MHGGSAPQVKAAAERRLDELRPKAIQYLDWLLDQKDFPSAGLGAAKDVLDRNDGKPHESVDIHHSGSVAIADVLRQRHAKTLTKMTQSHGPETAA